VSAADKARPIAAAEAAEWFADLADCKSLVLAVSGGPDSTALCLLAARWRESLDSGPVLLAVTIDHGLRPEARREAGAVKQSATALGLRHRTLRWTGTKPETGIQEAARTARYRLLAKAARDAGARHILTAHTIDDQAETVLFRLACGSGLSGLAAMAPVAPLPGSGKSELRLVRPFLDVPKARLIATLEAANIPYAVDPSNRDPRFARVRLRAAMPGLAGEGLTAARLARLARRARRADAAIEAAVDHLAKRLVPPMDDAAPANGPAPPPRSLAVAEWAAAPAEIRLRLLGRLVAAAGDEGPVELGKLESCEQALADHLRGRPGERFRRTLAGAVVTVAKGQITVGRAPPRRQRAARGGTGRSA
jgi:tRNA(Ile)-lysidine synthase